MPKKLSAKTVLQRLKAQDPAESEVADAEDISEDGTEDKAGTADREDAETDIDSAFREEDFTNGQSE